MPCQRTKWPALLYSLICTRLSPFVIVFELEAVLCLALRIVTARSGPWQAGVHDACRAVLYRQRHEGVDFKSSRSLVGMEAQSQHFTSLTRPLHIVCRTQSHVVVQGRRDMRLSQFGADEAEPVVWSPHLCLAEFMRERQEL